MTTPNEALRTILPIAGWGDTQAADVMFTGGADPVLPTPFRIGAAGAATLAASGLAATELWQVRTGRRQRVTVDLRQATAALRSGHYLQLAGTDVSSERNTIMGFYPTRDGRWSYLHCNFPNHRAAALSVLGVAEAHLPSLGYQELDTGHGKLSAELDLRARGDADILRGLVRKADVFSQGYRPGTLANRGLSPEELGAIRPGLVYVSLCAFSHAGPWASRRGFDTVVQTVSGMTIRQAEFIPGKSPAPQFYPVSAIDYCTGYLMAFGAMVALARRTREGGSWLVRISLAQVGKWIVDLGEVPPAAVKGIPAEFIASELERWSTVSETPSGRLRHLKPAVQLSETPPHWARPSVPLGYHRPVWP